jgi:hypothetical protein
MTTKIVSPHAISAINEYIAFAKMRGKVTDDAFYKASWHHHPDSPRRLHFFCQFLHRCRWYGAICRKLCNGICVDIPDDALVPRS